MRPLIRAFIAIELDERIKRELARVQDRLKTAEADIKWVDTSSIHLTLKFLGDIQPEVLDDVERAIARTAARFTHFHMDIGALGAFPDADKPRVIWASVTKRANYLHDMASRLTEELGDLASDDTTRSFTPHITLGRSRNETPFPRLTTLLKNTHAPAGLTQKVERIALFRSELLPKGPVYHLLYSVALGNDEI